MALIPDDAEMLLDSPAERVLVEALKHAESGAPRAVLVAGATDSMTTTYRGITVEALGQSMRTPGVAERSTRRDLLGVRLAKPPRNDPVEACSLSTGEVQPIHALRN